MAAAILICAASLTRATEAVGEIHSLKELEESPAVQAGDALPVDLEAVVTYYRGYERTLFVQDGEQAVYVFADPNLDLHPGDRVRINGESQGSFHPIILASMVTRLGSGRLPKALPATFDQMIQGQVDSRLVTARGLVRAADINYSSDHKSVQLQIAMIGGDIDAFIDTDDLKPFKAMLDSQVELTGVAGGRFDGKMDQIGVILHVAGEDGVKVVRPGPADTWKLPVTPMEQILKHYHVTDQSTRVHVQGTITYQQMGSAIVIQNKDHSLWVKTDENFNFGIGNFADVTGFPDMANGFLELDHGNVLDRNIHVPVQPVTVTWKDMARSQHIFDLITIEGKVLNAIREPTQDNFILSADGHMFSAVIRRRAFDTAGLAPLKQIRPGSIVRVTGVCVPGDSNPYNADVPFNVLMNGPEDLVMVAPAPFMNERNLLRIMGGMALIILTVSAWGWTLRRRVRRQSRELAVQAEAENALQRRIAHLEQRRRRIIEEINGDVPLAEILEQIADTTSLHLHDAPCWFEAANGKRYGEMPSSVDSLRLLQSPIPSPSGAELGVICAALPVHAPDPADASEALNEGARVAALAIETRRLYADLRHRSDFDQLTELHNRSYLERHVDRLIDQAQHTGSKFALIYIDLDRFKDINDRYGHHVGDLYLQEVTRRMKKQLRGADLLARLGGDEFVAIAPDIAGNEDVNEIVRRLRQCFETDFLLENYRVRGAASFGIALYPADGASRDELLRQADGIMYQEKWSRANRDTTPERNV